MKNLKKYRCEAALCLIAALAGFLSVFNIWNEGYSNEFYAASVKSMTLSLKNFFFVSLDPGGWVTVDKPPVSLWLQAPRQAAAQAAALAQAAASRPAGSQKAAASQKSSYLFSLKTIPAKNTL